VGCVWKAAVDGRYVGEGTNLLQRGPGKVYKALFLVGAVECSDTGAHSLLLGDPAPG
jgi:hypothetical protein